MITNMTAHSMCCRLSREPAQVRQAREQARKALVRWGLGEHADLAELIVSELATNAIRHGAGAVRVCVSFARAELCVDVHDDAAGRPARQQATADAESGRGLALLDGLIGLHGGRRGVAHDRAGPGKTAYVVIGLATDPAGDRATGASTACAHPARRLDAGQLSRQPPPAAPPCPARRRAMCRPAPRRPAADAPGREATRVIAGHPGQGWCLLCNGVVAVEDTGRCSPTAPSSSPTAQPAGDTRRMACRRMTRPRGAPVPHGRAREAGPPWAQVTARSGAVPPIPSQPARFGATARPGPGEADQRDLPAGGRRRAVSRGRRHGSDRG
jgi:anti-sigma regulatory factor (Ser/Thr protein kinase)